MLPSGLATGDVVEEPQIESRVRLSVARTRQGRRRLEILGHLRVISPKQLIVFEPCRELTPTLRRER